MDNCGTDDNEEILILALPISVPSEAQDLFVLNSVLCTQWKHYVFNYKL